MERQDFWKQIDWDLKQELETIESGNGLEFMVGLHGWSAQELNDGWYRTPEGMFVADKPPLTRYVGVLRALRTVIARENVNKNHIHTLIARYSTIAAWTREAFGDDDDGAIHYVGFVRFLQEEERAYHS